MELKINEYRCVICDPSADLMIESSKLETLSETEKSFIQKKVKKIRNSSEMNKGHLSKADIQGTILDKYLQEQITMDELCHEIASRIYDNKKEAGKFEGFDVFMIDGVMDECPFLAVMDCGWHLSYTHYTEADQTKTLNRIIEYKTNLSEGILKEDNLFFYDILNELVLCQ